MITAKQAKAFTLAATENFVVPNKSGLYETIMSVVEKQIEEACRSKCDCIEVKYSHLPAEISATVLVVDQLRALGFYARSFFNDRCTESKIVVGWGQS